MKKKIREKIKYVTVMCLLCTMLAGCTSPAEFFSDGTKIVVTRGEMEQGLFHIGNTTCSKEEYMLYLVNILNGCEKVYGTDIINTPTALGKIRDRVAKLAVSRLAQIKMMNLLADSYGVFLDEEEIKKCNEAAGEYYGSLNDREKEILSVTKEDLEQYYREYALAHKVYAYVIRDVNPEISDDEARSVTVDYIFLRGSESDSELKSKADEVYRLALVNEDFPALAVTWSDTRSMTMSFGKEEKPETIERAAFSMAVGDVSPPVYSENGYYILHMVSTFDPDETEENKLRILARRKKEAFNQVYEEFARDQILSFDRETFSQISYPDDDECVTSSFFDIYDEHLSDAF